MTNVIFLVIDSLRSDMVYSEEKSSLTPTLDSLIKKGVYHKQAISCSDQTGTSLASIFTSKFPCNTNFNEFTFMPDNQLLFLEFKKRDYETHSFVPDLDFFKKLVSDFTQKNFYEFENKESRKTINDGLGHEIISKIPNSTNPWLYFVHIMDIRPPFKIPDLYNNEKFGKSNYERLVSLVDSWLTELIKKINFENTILILTSDHGEYIPITNKFNKQNSKIQKLISKSTKSKPFLEKIGLKATMNIRFAYQTYQKEKLKYELSPLEMRSLNSRATLDLYDELIKVPLLFVGKDIPENKMISSLIRHVDIFPTLFSILKFQIPSDLDGIDISSKWENDDDDELSAYLEVGINAAQLIDETKEIFPKIIGIRTPKFKYYRSRTEPKKYVHVFDLINDPFEEENLSKKNPKLINELENKLQSLITKNVIKNNLSDDEIKKARDLLLKLGYI